jgi:hypothetical protein
MSPSQDVVELILKDHRMEEDLFRQMRTSVGDRFHALREFADLHVARVQAQETEVYPALQRFTCIDDALLDLGVAAHRKGTAALLDLLEAEERTPYAWGARLDDLMATVADHAREEEHTLLSSAREEITPKRRAELGAAFAKERASQLKSCCGNIDNVRRIVRGHEREPDWCGASSPGRSGPQRPHP